MGPTAARRAKAFFRSFLLTFVIAFAATVLLLGIARNAWANSVELTSKCGQVQVVNDHNHDRVTLSQAGVTHYTFKNNGTYNVKPGVYQWAFFHGGRPNGNAGTIDVPTCEGPSTTTTTLAPTTTTTQPTTTTTAPETTTTEPRQCFIPEGCDPTTTTTAPPVTTTTEPNTSSTTPTTIQIGTPITATATQAPAAAVSAQPQGLTG